MTSYSLLERARVQLILATQEFGDDASGRMFRNITSLFDEHFSIETRKHTRRTMRANAEEGFYNGGPVPLGYESRTVEVRGKKEKRKLFIHEEEAEVVRLMFDLAERGLGSGPMGAREIAKYLNTRNYSLCGRKFYNGNVAGILGRHHYTGRYSDMTVDEYGRKLPEEEWVWIECPTIVSKEQFDKVQAVRAERSPRVTAPRIVSGPTLLAGKAKCGTHGCGAGMTLATGKSGQYRYYRCAMRTNAGASSCTCRAIRVEKLDSLVINALAKQVFTEDRPPALLAKVLEMSDEAQQRRAKDLARAGEKVRAETALKGLLDLVEQGLMSPRDPVLAPRLAEYKQTVAYAARYSAGR